MKKTAKNENEIAATLENISTLTVKGLQALHTELFDEEINTRNKPYLIKKLTGRLEEMAKEAKVEKAGKTVKKASKKNDTASKRALAKKTPKRSAKAPSNDSNAEEKPRRKEERKAAVEKKSPAGRQPSTRGRDPRLPVPGTTLSRFFKGDHHEVLVKEEGFEYRGEHFRSLSRIATDIAGSNWNGFRFFKGALDSSANGAN